MLCTVKKTIETIISTGNNAVIQVKNNQKNLFKEAEILFDELKTETKYTQKITLAHGRKESRKVEVVIIPEILENNLHRWRHIKSIIKVNRLRDKFNTKKKRWECSNELSYYLSTFIGTAKELYQVIKSHWKIENLNHYVRDVSFKEDLSRIRVNPSNFAILRSFGMNILRNNNITNIAEERFLNCCNFENIFKYKDLC